MKTKRTHILLPHSLIREIDRIVGPRGRSAFLVETAQEAVRRRKLLDFLKNEEPAWENSDHPELRGDAATWVKGLRKDSNKHSQVRASRRKRSSW